MTFLGFFLFLFFGCMFTLASIGFLIYAIFKAQPGENWPFEQKWTLTVALIVFVILVFSLGIIFWPG